VVFKAFFTYKVKEQKDSDLITKTQTDMEAAKKDNDSKKTLKDEDYPKSNGKYNEAAMIRFLCESYEGKEHSYKSVGTPEKNPETPQTTENWTD